MKYLDISKFEKAQARELLDLLQTYSTTPEGYVLGYLYQRTRGAVEAAIYKLHQKVSAGLADTAEYRGLAAAAWAADQATLLQRHLQGIQIYVEPSNS